MATKRYLTKSRFKLATECETKLYYTRKKSYADQSSDNPFLMELAKGGYQVGELAKYYFYEDRPVPTVEPLNYDEALKETARLVELGEYILAEAAVQHDHLFIRVDIFHIDPGSKIIKFYEVKAKSCNENEDFLKNGNGDSSIMSKKIDTSWKPYLFDAAFQKYVIQKAYPGYQVQAYLMLVNKDAKASVAGLNQRFKIKGDTTNFEVCAEPGLTKQALGDEVLLKVNVDEEVEVIWQQPFESLAYGDITFDAYIQKLSAAYQADEKINAPITKVCKNCQFRTKSQEREQGLKSGIQECWVNQLSIDPEDFHQPKAIDIWGGKAGSKSVVQHFMDRDKYFLKDLDLTDMPGRDKEMDGLSPFERRWKQVEYAKANNEGYYFDRLGFQAEESSWKYPLHFIDFETASPALPFTAGAHPYEGIAFQFSHHTMDKHGKVEHRTQFLKTEPGVNPNLDFVRALKNALSQDQGTIFRYHNHENSYLRMLRNQISAIPDNDLDDKQALIEFIDSITQYKIDYKKIMGARNMVDMYSLVLRFYYSPLAGGSNSLKYILPAAIHDSPYLMDRYSRPICGRKREVSSLNFEKKKWIDPSWNNDPYKALPKIFEGYSREALDDLFQGMDELADGGAAMMAYAKLQFFDTPEDQRKAIENALYKYCELDTLAMVMLMEFWMHEK